MQRMYEEKRLQMERGSIGGSYFTLHLPDGTTEKRMKMPLNVDPGVHSSLNLEQLAAQSGGLHPVATLPTIAEAKVHDNSESPPDSDDSPIEMKKLRPARPQRTSESDSTDAKAAQRMNLPRNASQPAFTSHHQGIHFVIQQHFKPIYLAISFLLRPFPQLFSIIILGRG